MNRARTERRRAAALALVLCLAACAGGPPPYEGPSPAGKPGKRMPELVEITAVDPGIRLDVRYARSDNFLGRPVYSEARAFLQRPAAEALARVHARVRPLGFGLVVFDGYRPWSVTKLFWDSTPGHLRHFVADPADGSKHNRGCAVDLSLVHLDTGLEVAMPTPYDDFTAAAAADAPAGTETERRHRAVLREAMEAEGFTVYPHEWWHFDYRTWAEYPILDIPFAEIGRHVW